MLILIVSEIPTHPVVEGNRSAIMSQIKLLTSMGHEVHFLHCNIHKSYESETCWGDCYHFYKLSLIQRIKQYLISKYRKYFCGWYWNCDDYYPFMLHKEVQKLHKKYNFGACIVHYYYLSKLFDKIEIPKKALYAHDYFSYKNLLIGKKSFLSLLPNEEAKAMQRSPFIFAINDEEGIYFKMLSPQSIVYNVYASYSFYDLPIMNNHNILFFSGSNQYNINGLNWFIKNIFPLIIERYNDVKLCIGGSICNKLKELSSNPYIDLLGTFENPLDFYKLGDIVINPTYQGTGLKIKTLEALSYGKYVIVHPHSTIGIFMKHEAPIFCSCKPKQWLDYLKNAWSSPVNLKHQKELDSLYLSKMNEYISNQYKAFIDY